VVREAPGRGQEETPTDIVGMISCHSQAEVSGGLPFKERYQDFLVRDLVLPGLAGVIRFRR